MSFKSSALMELNEIIQIRINYMNNFGQTIPIIHVQVQLIAVGQKIVNKKIVDNFGGHFT